MAQMPKTVAKKPSVSIPKMTPANTVKAGTNPFNTGKVMPMPGKLQVMPKPNPPTMPGGGMTQFTGGPMPLPNPPTTSATPDIISGGISDVGGNYGSGRDPFSGQPMPTAAAYKKGGHVKASKTESKKSYTSSGGKINLSSGRVSTASKNKKNPNW